MHCKFYYGFGLMRETGREWLVSRRASFAPGIFERETLMIQ